MTQNLEYEKHRNAMIEHQLIARGLHDPLIIQAISKIPREEFVPADLRNQAYLDQPLPISQDQTISQPYMVAWMTQEAKLEGGEHVLEIGTGSGYGAAVLSKIASDVFTIERISELAETAKIALRKTGCSNVHVVIADGTKGLSKQAPFDAIIVTAGGPAIPKALKEQLKIGGRLVLPIGEMAPYQQLIRITRTQEESYKEEALGAVRFVPLVSEKD